MTAPRNRGRPSTPLPVALPLLGLMAVAACAPGAPETGAGGTPTPPDGGLAAAPPPSEPAPVPAGVPAPPGRYDDEPVDVLHYELELALSDSAAWIAGRARLRVAVTEPPPARITLDFTGLAVDGVTVDGAPVDAPHADGLLRIPIPGAGTPGVPASDTVTVEVAYRGVPDDGLVIGRNVHGEPAVFADNWPNRARFWFPSRDHPSDKATVAFTVHAPARWQVVANGGAVAEPAPTPAGVGGPAATGPRRTWRWATSVPIPTYTMVVGAAEMVVDTVGTSACGDLSPTAREAGGCVVTTTWFFPPDTARAAPSFRRAAEMVELYARMLGPFPYEKLAHVQSATRFGGMENAAAIFYSESALAEGRDIEGTVAHEIVHQWFGDHVTEAEWTHLWLSEGFATYLGAVFFERADGVEAFRERMRASRERYRTSPVVGRPVLDPEVDDLFALLNANHYQKGGWVLHMLRREIGDDAFFAGLRRYVERFAPGTALTGDFRAVMEEASGRDLVDFFDLWLREPGLPLLDPSWEWDAGAREVVLTVEQHQPGTWPVFRVPVEVELRVPGAAGASGLRHTVRLEGRTTTVRLPAPTRPDTVVLDPDAWLLWGPAPGTTDPEGPGSTYPRDGRDAAAPGPGGRR